MPSESDKNNSNTSKRRRRWRANRRDRTAVAQENAVEIRNIDIGEPDANAEYYIAQKTKKKPSILESVLRVAGGSQMKYPKEASLSYLGKRELEKPQS